MDSLLGNIMNLHVVCIVTYECGRCSHPVCRAGAGDLTRSRARDVRKASMEISGGEWQLSPHASIKSCAHIHVPADEHMINIMVQFSEAQLCT